MSSIVNWNPIKVRVGDLKGYESNPRTITSEKFESLKKSIENKGIFKPLILKHDRATLLGGNQRQLAILKQVPVDFQVWAMVPPREMSEEEYKDIVLLDNSHYGEFDLDIIANEFDVKRIEELNIDLKIPEIENLDAPFDLDESENQSDDENKKYLVEVQLPNELEQSDLYDDLLSKGFMVKKK